MFLLLLRHCLSFAIILSIWQLKCTGFYFPSLFPSRPWLQNHYECYFDNGISRPIQKSRDVLLFQLYAQESSSSSSSPEEPTFISDAEALLACWSYLKKRKKLGNWTQFEERKAIRAASEPHFFTDRQDLENEYRISNNYDGNDDDVDDEEGGIDNYMDKFEDDLITIAMYRNDRNPNVNNNMDDIWSGKFTSFPTEPSPSRIRRSAAKKRMWSDPEFRKRWYEKRWGQKKKKSVGVDKALLRKRVQALPSNFLGSPQLASMSEEDIDYAIKTYLQAREKRSKSRSKTIAERKKMLRDQLNGKGFNETLLERNSLYTVDEETMKNEQRQRSEIAKQAYETRLKNKPKKTKLIPRTSQRKYLPKGEWPQDVKIRIEDSISCGRCPSVDDLELMMKPAQFSGRRELLREILNDFFDLRGKCIPSDPDNPDSKKLFVTTAPVRLVGKFVIHLVKEGQSKKETME